MVVGGKMCGVPMRELESDEDFWDESRDVPSFQMSFPNSPQSRLLHHIFVNF